MGAFESYYLSGEAETWEFLAMTRARVVWSTSPAFADDAARTVDRALRRPRPENLAADVLSMRDLMTEERPASGFWDLKLSPGGLVDIEFAAQHLQLAHADAGGPLRQNTGEALRAFVVSRLAPPGPIESLHAAWVMQQSLSQLLKVALDDRDDPDKEPKAFRALLARAGGARDFRALKTQLAAARTAAHQAFQDLVKA
jgi:glutamate-ammonia-ligase adenylyltransferase